MIDCELYPAIFKRKSFHLFRDIGTETFSLDELHEIKYAYRHFSALCPDIKTEIRIVPAEETTCRRGEEYCILLYSEKKEHYLQNIGYIGQQLDLYLALKNIGTLWFGIGKTEESRFEGLDFVIMLAIAKVGNAAKFRKDMFKSKRKRVEEIWLGEHLDGVTDVVRFAPSACNTQPWMTEHKGSILKVYRYKKPGKRGIMHRIVDEEIKLVRYYPNYAAALEWYQDLELCKQVDNRDTVYDLDLLKRMYKYLNKHGYLFYIKHHFTTF